MVDTGCSSFFLLLLRVGRTNSVSLSRSFSQLKAALYALNLPLSALCPPLQPSPAGKAPARRAAARRRGPRLPLRRFFFRRRRRHRRRRRRIVVSSVALFRALPAPWSLSQPCSRESSTSRTRSWTCLRSEPQREPPERQQERAVAAAAAPGGGARPICPRC